MHTTKSVSTLLSKKSALAGWDVMVAYNRDRVNKLFYEQYLKKVAAGQNYRPFSHVNSKYGIHFTDIVIGPPLVSFENSSVADSAVTVSLNFISGSIIYTNTDGQVEQWDRINPGAKYGLKIRAELKYGSGNVSNEGRISIDFNEGTLLDIEGMNELPSDILEYFRSYIQKNPMSYTLGELKHQDDNKLYPKSFIVRTQRHPDADKNASAGNIDGAVLLFIETNYGGKGYFPTNEQPWVIPEDKTATMLISEKLLFGPLLAENFTDRVTNLKWESTLGSQGESLLRFTQGYVPTKGVIKGSGSGFGHNYHIESTDSKGNPRPARLSMADFQLSRYDDHTIIGQFISKDFTDTFRDRGNSLNANGGSSSWDYVRDCRFSRSGKFSAKIAVDNNGNVVFNGLADFELKTTETNFNTIGTDPVVKFAKEATDNLNKRGLFELNDIKTFYIRSILFPEDNILSFSDVACPGDLVLYGNVSESLMALDVSPKETTVAAGQSLTFKALLPNGTVPSGLVWSVDGVGSIDRDGVYTAPRLGEITQMKNVTVKAKTSDGRTGTALIMVLRSELELKTPFIFISEDKAPATFDFATYLTGTSKKISWKLESDLALPGTIDQNGVYTPPGTGNYDDGFNVVMAIASLPSGVEKKAIICLGGKDTDRAFKMEPAYHVRVPQRSAVGFSTRNRDFNADQWEMYPDAGSLTGPERQLDGRVTVWSITYHSPETIIQPELVFVKTSDEYKPWQGGYGLVELQPAASAWSRVCSLSFLEINSADGTPTASVYGNGLNQCSVALNITALDKYGYTVAVPAEDIYPYIELVDYHTGEALSQEDVWAYTNQKNEYNNQLLTKYSSMNIPFYITCDVGNKIKKIAVKIKLINPDAEYKYYTTASNSPNGMDSGVTITSLQPINYSDPQNIIISKGEPVKVNESLWYVVKENENSYEDKFDGECYKYEVKIAPRTELKTTFKKIETHYSTVSNERISNGTEDWRGLKAEMGFSCLTNKGMSCCSVVGHTTNASAMLFFDGNDYAANSSVELDGAIYFNNKDDGRKYQFNLQKFSDSPVPRRNDLVNFTGYEFNVPTVPAKALNWSSSLNEVQVSVTDEYGNSGVMKLRWDDNKNYHDPSIN